MKSSLKLNTFYLFIVQGSTHLLPLITFPYLVRVLGPTGFGTLAFAQATIQYFTLLTDYGFNLSTSKAIAQNSKSHTEVERIFWSTFFAKIALAIISFMALCTLVLAVKTYREIADVLFFYFIGVVGSALTPTWFFQGMEKMRPLTISSLISRATIIPLTFMLVKSPQDLSIAAAFQGSAGLLVGLVGLFLVYKDKTIKRILFSPRDIIDSLKDGWHVFTSTAAISLYTVSTTVILGFISGPAAVGLFNAVNTIKNAATFAFTPFSQALYPRINSLFQTSYNEAIALLRKALRIQGSVAAFVSIMLFVFAELIEQLVLGSKFTGAALVIRIFAPIPFLTSLSNILGIQTMLTHGYKKEFSRILITSGFLNIALIFPLCTHLAAKGAAISVLLTETFVTICMILFLKKKNHALFGRAQE
ncbi:flippase [Bdellovibrio sp. HCB274]|uniref:flippase n=1 Tax=Bdellovibrio sp. HCB274 TaxID=3394361 RepID=UPI0039B46636